MNNGVNNSEEQIIPGVKVAPPSATPVDASTADVGAAVSNIQPIGINLQQVSSSVGAIKAEEAPTVVVSNAVQNPVTQTVVSTPNTGQLQAMPVVTEATTLNNQLPTEEGSGMENTSTKVKKTKNKPVFLFLIIILLMGACAFLWFYHQQEMMRMNAACTPVSTTSGSKELDLDATIVKDLYSRVYTTIREDLGNSELNDELKLYLAYRQIPNNELYESHCNMFKTAGMEPFVCEASLAFVPKAFKEEALQLEVKKLFGDNVNIQNQNIQLGKTCIGGFQYIAERGEYVQGQCQSTGATMYRVDKELISATSTESTIVLKERVKYYGAEGLEVPARLVSGVYEYTFKLDMNYNYIYVSKKLSE